MTGNTFESKNTLASEGITEKNVHIIKNEHVSIDAGMLYHVSDNDADFVHSTIHVFLRNMQETIYKIEQSVKTRDWNKVYRYAHSAQSSLCIIKIEEMSDWLTYLKENAENRANYDNIVELVKRVKERYFFAQAILSEEFPVKSVLTFTEA